MPECLENGDDCQGDVEFRYPLSGTGQSFPRCDFHWQKRLFIQEEIDRKYSPNSDVAPSWFNDIGGGMNEYGERWDDE
jgi:hypothetical protein